jgi:hypothetical protein
MVLEFLGYENRIQSAHLLCFNIRDVISNNSRGDSVARDTYKKVEVEIAQKGLR